MNDLEDCRILGHYEHNKSNDTKPEADFRHMHHDHDDRVWLYLP